MNKKIPKSIAPLKQPNIKASTKFERLHLYLILVLTPVLAVVKAVGLVSHLLLEKSQKAVNQIVHRLVNKRSDLVSERLNNYLKTPQKINQLNLKAIALT